MSYGISMTTLEEVFLKVNGELEEDDQEPTKEDRGSLQRNSEEEGVLISDERKTNENIAGQGLSSENLVGHGTLWQSVKALIIKRFNIYKRDKCGLCCELIVPVILVLFGLGLLQIPFLKDSASFTLDTSAYPSP